ncbi:MAG: MFS transporter [Firmicutes bacterium]|nr:MFS transporter [Bacillota bacterium]
MSTTTLPSSTALDTREAKSHLGLLTWAHFLNDGSSNYLPGVLPAILIALHEPVAAAGTLMAALLIGQALQPLTGILSDRVGGKSIFIFGLLGSAIGGAMIGFSREVWLLVLFLFMIGIGNSLFHPQALAIVRAAAARKRQGLSLSAFLVGGELGRGLFPVLTSWIVVALGLPFLFLIAVPTLITVPFLFKNAPRLDVKKRVSGDRIAWRKHLGPMWFLIGFASLRSLMSYGIVTYMPVLWHDRGGALVVGASIVTTVLVVGIVGNLLGGHLADRFGRRPLLIASSVLGAALLPLMVVVGGAWLWVCAGALGIALFSTSPVTVLMGQDIFPENRSLGSGIALGLANGIGAMLVFASGQFVSAIGIHGILLAVGLCGLVATGLACAMPKAMVVAHAEGASAH